MKKFQFSMDPLLKVRQEKENLAQRDLAQATMELHIVLSQLQIMEEEETTLSVTIRQKQGSGKLDAANLRDSLEYLSLIKRRIAKHQDTVLKIKNIVEAMRQALTLRRQEKKVLENLKDKQYSLWEEQLKAEEGLFIDEMATLRYIRGHRTE